MMITNNISVSRSLFDAVRLKEALHITKRRLDSEYRKHGWGAVIDNISHIPSVKEDDDTIRFWIEVRQGNRTRFCKLRFESTDDCRNKVEQFRGKRDLTMMVIFIRIRDRLGQILNRIYKRISLIVADIRREIDYFRRTGRFDQPPETTFRKWRKKRRHWCHRPGFVFMPG